MINTEHKTLGPSLVCANLDLVIIIFFGILVDVIDLNPTSTQLELKDVSLTLFRTRQTGLISEKIIISHCQQAND